MPIAASGCPLIIGVPSVSGPHSAPPSSESSGEREPAARRAAARRAIASSPAANELLFGMSLKTITRSRKPWVAGTSLAIPSTTIAPAMPLPTSYDDSPCGCG
jgi:hypothetical protein